MNFNLTSPYNSAQKFTARFKDDIEVPGDASVYLNHFKVKRDRRIVLLNNNSIVVTPRFQLPQFQGNRGLAGDPATGTPQAQVPTLNSGLEPEAFTINVPAGTYSALDLNILINRELQTLFNRNGTAVRQVTVTAGVSANGQANITLAVIGNVRVGDRVTGNANIPANSNVVSINGATITISANITGGGVPDNTALTFTPSYQNTRGEYNCGPIQQMNSAQTPNTRRPNGGMEDLALAICRHKKNTTITNDPPDNNNQTYQSTNIDSHFTPSAAHIFNATIAPNADGGVTYQKTANVDAAGANLYNNYALHDEPLYHYSIDPQNTRTNVPGTNQTVLGLGAGDAADSVICLPAVRAQSIHTLGDYQAIAGAVHTAGGGRDFIGLYSIPYANGVPQIQQAAWDGGNKRGFELFANRTQGTGATMPLKIGAAAASQIPACFFGVELGGPNVNDLTNFRTMKIIAGGRLVGGARRLLCEPTQVEAGMRVDTLLPIAELDMTSDTFGGELGGLDDTDEVELAIVPFYDTQPIVNTLDPRPTYSQGYVNRERLHFKVCVKIGGEWRVVFNTQEQINYVGSIHGNFMEQFNTGGNNSDQSNDMVDMNIPFHAMLSSSCAETTGGWTQVMVSEFVRGGTANKRTIVDGVDFTFSNELSTYIDSAISDEAPPPGTTQPTTYRSQELFPSIPWADTRLELDFGPLFVLPVEMMDPGLTTYAGALLLRDLYTNEAQESYVVYINNLPLTNYKNTRSQRLPTQGKSGYGKNILANIPIPYQTNYSVGNSMIGYYEPFNKQISNLKNQPFKTNYFDIEVRRARDDVPAKYLQTTTLNFTIVDKDSKFIN